MSQIFFSDKREEKFLCQLSFVMSERTG